jgi:hypothetical protein
MAGGAALLATRRLTAGSKALILGGSAAAFGGLALASLVGTNIAPDPFKGATMRFPLDLGQLGHWIQFTAHSTNGVGASIGQQVDSGSIYLPMPSNLSTNYHPDYTSESLGTAAGGVLKPFDRAMYGNTDIPKSAEAGAAMAGLGAAAIGAAAKSAGVTLDTTGPTAAAALKVAAGLAQNPHKIVLFTGVNFREHQFSWRFSPRNRRESDAIKAIIDMFTYYSHPEYIAGGMFFKYPEFFDIKFKHPDYLFEFQPSVCKDVRVNYHPQGYAAYNSTDNPSDTPAPAEVEFSFTMMETEIITKNSLNPKPMGSDAGPATFQRNIKINVPDQAAVAVRPTQPPGTGR